MYKTNRIGTCSKPKIQSRQTSTLLSSSTSVKKEKQQAPSTSSGLLGQQGSWWDCETHKGGGERKSQTENPSGGEERDHNHTSFYHFKNSWLQQANVRVLCDHYKYKQPEKDWERNILEPFNTNDEHPHHFVTKSWKSEVNTPWGSLGGGYRKYEEEKNRLRLPGSKTLWQQI